MITTSITLTDTPQLITVPATGARLQSTGGLEFRWVASATTPANKNTYVRDIDVWIGQATTLYAWATAKGQVITVTA
jgi:hypothetical protein